MGTDGVVLNDDVPRFVADCMLAKAGGDLGDPNVSYNYNLSTLDPD
jgi:hypothetical protein